MAFLADWLEEAVLFRLGARFVVGRAPWEVWERGMRRQYDLMSASNAETPEGTTLDEDSEDWVDLGSVRY